MKKWNLLDQAATPDGGTMGLYEHDGAYTIRVNGVDLMSTRRHASEERLAELVCTVVQGRPAARVLIGGLGLGFTLKAALAVLAPAARVVVAELMPAVVAWNRNPDYGLAAAALADPRVQIAVEDVWKVVTRSPAGFDGLMLDVDNGPAALSAAGNDRLYQEVGLHQIRAALRPGGIVGFWSARADPAFERTLQRAGFAVTTERARSHTTSGGWHTLFLGRIA